MKTDQLIEQISSGHVEASAGVEVAAALLALAMQESNGPVAELGTALERMTRLLGNIDPELHSKLPPQVRALHDLMARELAVCIQGLQFHDRLTQQIAQVRNLLASIAIETEPSLPALSEQCWSQLLRSLRGRFTSDSHRALFDLLLPMVGTGSPSEPRSLRANEGSVELF